MLVHDLRRTAVRNLERACVPHSAATKLTCHKTEAVYRRYAITNEQDLAGGIAKLAKLHGAPPNRDTVRRKSRLGGGGENTEIPSLRGLRSDRAGVRTQDLRIKSPLLCQLSYPVGGFKLHYVQRVIQAFLSGIPCLCRGQGGTPATRSSQHADYSS